MPDYYRETRVVETVEYHVPTNEPWGACWSEVQQAINAAIRELNPRDPSDLEAYEAWQPADDAVRVYARDDEVVISFRKDG